MPLLEEIAVFDVVELLTPVESVPAGARGGVLELRERDVAMVEIMSPSLDATERIVFVPLTSLRRVS